MSVKSIDFSESNIPQLYVKYIKDRWCYNSRIDVIPNLYRVMFNSITTFLKYYRTKSKPHIGFKLMDDAGDFYMGAVLDFHAPEGESEDTGNWTLSFTLNEADMKDLDEVYDNFSDMFISVVNQEMHATAFGYFNDSSAATNMFVAMVDVLKEQLDILSNSGDEYELTMPGIFMACVGFEDGQKVYSIIPGHNIKQQIKDDKGLSK